AFPPGGEDDKIGVLQQRVELGELREPDLAFGDEIGAADVEVVAAAASEVHELPAGSVLAETEPEALALEPLEELPVEVLRVLGGEDVRLSQKGERDRGGDEVAILERRALAVEGI